MNKETNKLAWKACFMREELREAGECRENAPDV